MRAAEVMRAVDAVAAGRLLATKEIIDPPQYSVAWLILAVLCLLVIGALVLGTLRITRALAVRRAEKHRPDDVQALKAEYLRTVNDIADRHAAGAIAPREAHHELTAVMRRFVRRTTGLDVTAQDVAALERDPRTRDVGALIGRLYEPDFARVTDAEVSASVHDAREVIRRWS